MTGGKIVVGMSGGVDSSMALLLLKKEGWKPVGVSLKLPVWKNKENLLRENICCTADSLRIAREVCKKLGARHHIVDARRAFRREVMDYFLRELKECRTPNPCVMCNRHLKFKMLLEWAKKRGIKYVATGHYARVRKNAKSGRFELAMPKDKGKDQTYGLCLLPQEWLSHLVFPLGDYTKKEVYRMAGRAGFEIFLKKKQSQDLCFVSGRSMQAYLKEKLGSRPGGIVDSAGNAVGRHRGLHFYTIGQRRGLRLPGAYFVKSFDVPANRLVVTEDRKELGCREVLLSGLNFISGKGPGRKFAVSAKIRYRQKPVPAVLFPLSNGRMRLVFKRPVEAVPPGQVCAFYRGQECLGGGFIVEAQ